MTKKNTRSCSHKHVKAALCAAMCSVLTAMPTFAAGEDNSAATTGDSEWSRLHHGLRHAVLPGRHLESVTTPLLTKGGDGLWAF